MVRRDGNYKEVFKTERLTHPLDNQCAFTEDQVNVFAIYEPNKLYHQLDMPLKMDDDEKENKLLPEPMQSPITSANTAFKPIQKESTLSESNQ